MSPKLHGPLRTSHRAPRRNPPNARLTDYTEIQWAMVMSLAYVCPWYTCGRDIMVSAISCSCFIMNIIPDFTCLAMTKGSIVPCHRVPGPWTSNSCNQNDIYRYR